MFPVIPTDIPLAGMGYNADDASQFFLPVNQIRNTRENRRRILHKIIDPAHIFFVLLFFCKLPATLAHTGKTVVVTVMDIVIEGDSGTRPEMLENFTKIGIT
jgi:hypothetical protein